MEHIAAERISWKAALQKERPLLMPVAHDGLSARLLEQAGFVIKDVYGDHNLGPFTLESQRMIVIAEAR